MERARELGCRALQIFTQSPGRWRGPAVPEEAATRFRSLAVASGLSGRCFAHAPYLINVATGDRELRERSLRLLEDQLRRAIQLELAGVVLHPGAHGGRGVKAGLQRAAGALAEVLERVPEGPRLLLEVTAGQGTVLGSTWRELGELLRRLPANRTGVCWDTAHLWGAGFALDTDGGWAELWAGFTGETGRALPDLVHLNDTEVERGSHRDRHERIGFGRLGVSSFARIVRDSRLRTTPMILETPKGPPNADWDRDALELLRRLC